MFSRKKATGFAGDDFESLNDAFDDQGKQKSKKDQKKAPASAADGGRTFENLGSSAVTRTVKKFEDEKEAEPKAAP